MAIAKRIEKLEKVHGREEVTVIWKIGHYDDDEPRGPTDDEDEGDVVWVIGKGYVKDGEKFLGGRK